MLHNIQQPLIQFQKNSSVAIFKSNNLVHALLCMWYALNASKKTNSEDKIRKIR